MPSFTPELRPAPPEKLTGMHREAQSGRNFAAIVIALAVVFAFVARQYLHRYALPPQAVVSIYLCFLLLLILALAPAVAAVRAVIAPHFPPRFKLFFLAIWTLPYLIYAAGAHDFHWPALLRLLAISAPAPLLYWACPVRNLARFSWQDALLAAWMIAAVLFHGFRDIWTVPVNLDFISRLFLIAVASSTWTFIRPVPGLGYEFVLSATVLKAATLNFVLFAAIALPASLALHFTTWNPHWRGPLQFAADFLEIFLFIALLEELFFRGFLQNLFSRTFPQPWQGQLLASGLFGLSHIFHAPVPNWRYVALASVAGWFYGSAFRSGGAVLASGLTHALVDTAWRTWFSRI